MSALVLNNCKLNTIGTLLMLAMSFHNEAYAGTDQGSGLNNSFTVAAQAGTGLEFSQVINVNLSNNTGSFEKLFSGNHAGNSIFTKTPSIDRSHHGGSFSPENSGYSHFRTDTGKFTIASVVPEPKVYVMLLAGLGFLGFRTRQNSSK